MPGHVLAERSDVHAREDDLAVSGGREPLRLGGFVEGARDVATSNVRDDAEGTAQVAPVLDFQERPGVAVESGNPEIEDRGLEVLGGELRILDQERQGGLLVMEHDAPDPRHAKEVVAVRVGRAPRHRDLGGRAATMDPADGPGGLGVGGFRHRARVEDVDLRVFLGADDLETGSPQAFLERLRLVLVHFATERDDRAPLHRRMILPGPQSGRQL